MRRRYRDLCTVEAIRVNFSRLAVSWSTMAAIAKAVAERFGVPSGLLFTASRQHQISHPRQVAMYLCRKHTNNSLPAIGRFFGGKHHTTVMHALRHVEHELSVNFELRRFVEVFSEQCRDPPIRMGSPIVLPAEIPAEIPAHLKKPGALKAAIALRDELAVSEKK